MGTPRQKRIAALILLSSLALSAFFLAQGTTQLVAAALLPVDYGTAALSAARRGSGREGGSAGRERVTDAMILKRNIFDARGDITHPPAPEPDPEEVGDGDEEIDPNAEPEACEGELRLVASVYNGRLPDWSFAALAEGNAVAMLYREGMTIGGTTLVEILPDRVMMRPSGDPLCYLQMFNMERMEARRRMGRAPVTRSTTRGDEDDEESSDRPSNEEMQEGITRVSDTEYTVERGLVEEVLGDQAQLMRSARVIPHEEDGQVVGVKLYGIRRSSVLGRLGIRNGDMLKTINGFDMTSPDSALEAFARLQSADHLTVNLVRRGQPTTIEYSIQ